MPSFFSKKEKPPTAAEQYAARQAEIAASHKEREELEAKEKASREAEARANAEAAAVAAAQAAEEERRQKAAAEPAPYTYDLNPDPPPVDNAAALAYARRQDAMHHTGVPTQYVRKDKSTTAGGGDPNNTGGGSPTYLDQYEREDATTGTEIRLKRAQELEQMNETTERVNNTGPYPYAYNNDDANTDNTNADDPRQSHRLKGRKTDEELMQEYRQMMNPEAAAASSPVVLEDAKKAGGDEAITAGGDGVPVEGAAVDAAVVGGVVVSADGTIVPMSTEDAGVPMPIALDYADAREMSQYIFDAPDPEFYLGAALIIGTVCLCTWMTEFILDYGDIHSMYLWIITCSGSFGVFFVIPFLIYLATSQHYNFGGKLWDALAGSLPCFVAAFGLLFIYAFGIETIVRTVHYGTIRGQFLIYGTIPIFLVVVLPTFVAMLMFQSKCSDRYRAMQGYPPVEDTMMKRRVLTSGWLYLGVMLRRVIVGWVCGVALAAHIALPAYALSWCAYGLWLLQDRNGIWVIFVIVIPPIVVVVTLALIPFTRFIIQFGIMLLRIYFIYPLQGWDPRHGTLWPLYDNSMTYERMTQRHNDYVHDGKVCANGSKGDSSGRSAAYFLKAAQLRQELEDDRIPLVMIDPITGKPIPRKYAPPAPENANAPDGEAAGPPAGNDVEGFGYDDDSRYEAMFANENGNSHGPDYA